MLFIKKTFPQDLSILVKPWCLIEICWIFLKIGYFRITVLFNKTWFIISLVFKELSRKFQGSLIGSSKKLAPLFLIRLPYFSLNCPPGFKYIFLFLKLCIISSPVHGRIVLTNTDTAWVCFIHLYSMLYQKTILNSVVENKFTTLISQQLMNIYYYKLKQCIHLLQVLV